MKNRLIHYSIFIFLLLSASAAHAHGVHIQELKQSSIGITGEFTHLFIEHAYWLLVLLAGSGLAVILSRRTDNHPQQKHKSYRTCDKS